MGLQITKIIGFGTDQALSLPLNYDKMESLSDLDPLDFADFMSVHYPEFTDPYIRDFELARRIYQDNQENFPSFDEVVTWPRYEVEDNGNVFVMTPWSMVRKNHFNDYIDGYDYEQRYGKDGGYRSKYHFLERTCLWPWQSLMRKTETKVGMETYWESLWGDSDDWQSHVPLVPYDLKLLLEFSGLVSSPKEALDVYFSLRPMIYTYWL